MCKIPSVKSYLNYERLVHYGRIVNGGFVGGIKSLLLCKTEAGDAALLEPAHAPSCTQIMTEVLDAARAAWRTLRELAVDPDLTDEDNRSRWDGERCRDVGKQLEDMGHA